MAKKSTKKAAGKKKPAAKKKSAAKKKTTAKKVKKAVVKKDKKPPKQPKNLAEFVASISTGKDALDVFLCDDHIPADTTFVSTRSPLLNLFLSERADGGIPLGRIIEVYGQPDSGKTSLLTEAMISFQEAGGVALFHDSDFKFNRERAERRGWNPKKTIYIPDKGIEDILESTKQIVMRLRSHEFAKDMPILFAWDSAPSTPLRANVPGYVPPKGTKVKKGGMMESARIMWDKLVRELTGFLSDNNVTVIATSPEIAKITPGFRSSKTTALGGAIKFVSTIRIKTWRPYPSEFKFTSDDTEPASGVYIAMNATKHGIRIQPDKQITVSYLFDRGFTSYYDPLNYLVITKAKTANDKQVVTNTSGYWRILDFDKAFRFRDAAWLLYENPEIHRQLIAAMESHFVTGVAVWNGTMEDKDDADVSIDGREQPTVPNHQGQDVPEAGD